MKCFILLLFSKNFFLFCPSGQQALALTFLSGALFFIVSLVAGKKAITFIPENLRHAITAGIGLLSDLKKIHFDAIDDTIPAMLTITVIPLAYSITTGIAAGFLSHIICKLAAKKAKEIHLPMIILCLIFVLYFSLGNAPS